MPRWVKKTEQEEREATLSKIKERTTYEGDCWRYTGGKTAVEGHGRVTYQGRKVVVSRFIAHVYHDLTLETNLTHKVACHKAICKFKDCWNPEHIYVGMPKDNAADTIAAGNFHYADHTQYQKED